MSNTTLAGINNKWRHECTLTIISYLVLTSIDNVVKRNSLADVVHQMKFGVKFRISGSNNVNIEIV